jgi:uncharacterized protein (DUF2141 family)
MRKEKPKVRKMIDLQPKTEQLWWAWCLALGLTGAVTSLQAEPATGELVVEVLGLPSSDGMVRFALFDSVETYKKRKGAVRKADLPIENQTCEWRIKDLPYGEYALMLYHDENGNNKMDKNFVGIPKEGYGFSNNAKPRLSAPGHERVKFEINGKQKTLQVQLQR